MSDEVRVPGLVSADGEKKVTPVAALIAEGFVDIADVMMALPVIFGCDVIVRPVKAVPA